MSHDHPIIVRKKASHGEEEHHGGVWKLAFADFMTAMMAFFLVMWLINSTSKETKAVIVQYFNPIQLVDSTNAHKGLRDPAAGAQGKSATAPAANESAAGASASNTEALFAQPIEALDKIAQEEPPTQTLRDPFDRPSRIEMRVSETPAPQPEAPLTRGRGGGPHPPAAAKETEKVAKTLAAEIDKIAAREGTHAPKVEVQQVEEGLLISLTDDADFSMFDVGSVHPRPQLVRIMAEIGKMLATRPGDLEVRGHTDGRNFAGKNYDNWRLSSDRANVVNYMLIRGGLPAARIGRIVGFADRRLKKPNDPLSPLNRRIEILLRGAAP